MLVWVTYLKMPNGELEWLETDDVEPGYSLMHGLLSGMELTYKNPRLQIDCGSESGEHLFHVIVSKKNNALVIDEFVSYKSVISKRVKRMLGTLAKKWRWSGA
jgi:hypothetical protein